MRDYTKFYINGAWVAPSGSDTLAVENPATLEQCATIAIGNETDVDTAVAAAKAALRPLARHRWKSAPHCWIKLQRSTRRELVKSLRRFAKRWVHPSLWHRQLRHTQASPTLRKRQRSYETFPSRGPWCAPRGQGAHRRLWPDYAMELAHEPGHLQGGSSAGSWLYDGAQAQRSSATFIVYLHRNYA